MLKRLFISLVITTAVIVPSHAQSVPKIFQGNWVDTRNGKVSATNADMKVSATNVDFGSGFRSKIISVMPANEDGDKIMVKWASSPSASPVEAIWWLTKVNGREVLVDVNVESPSSIAIYQRR
jgi:hypothetical protein